MVRDCDARLSGLRSDGDDLRYPVTPCVLTDAFSGNGGGLTH